MNLTQKIEAYLFYSGEPVAIKKIAKLFEISEGHTKDALGELVKNLEGHGMVLMEHGDEVQMVTAPEMGELLVGLKKQELSDPLSRGAMETLTIILYKNGATKPEIDFIRGVNSQFMLRNLLIRGLIEKVPNPDDARITKYQTTFETLRFLGITSVEELPQFESFKQEIIKREESGQAPEQNVFTE